tara:strand:+ start:12694 stop:12870 length:177 start_codon:yes stop_codon:yes gene_type:complete
MKIAPPIDEETYKRMKILAAIHGATLQEIVPVLLNFAIDQVELEVWRPDFTLTGKEPK